MSYELTDEITEIDLSKLISFSMSFQPLQLLFQGVLKRVKDVEAENEQQDGEIDQLKKALEELRQRDAEREAQLEELLQQQKKLQEQQDALAREQEEQRGILAKEQEEQQDILSREEGEQQDVLGGEEGEQQDVLGGEEGEQQDISAKEQEEMRDKQKGGKKSSIFGDEAGVQYADLSALWEEVEKIKKQLGEFSRPGYRHSIEQLYEARKRQSRRFSSSSDPKQQRRMSDFAGDSAGDVGATTGDAILDRAKEELVLSGDPHLPPVQEVKTPAPGETMEPPHAQSVKEIEDVKQESDQAQTKSHESLLKKGPQTSSSHEMLSLKEKSDPYSAGPERSASGYSGPKIVSVHGSPTFNVPLSVNDCLRRDSNDIERLNRVVAEILNEMKGLHADMDLIRTVTTETNKKESELPIDSEEMKKVYDKYFQRTEEAPKDDSTSSTKAPTAAGDEHLTALKMRDLLKLKDRMDALEQAQERMNNKLETATGALSASEGDSSVNPVRLAVLEAAVKTLEKQLADLQNLGLRNYDQDLEALERALANLKKDTEALEKACALLDEKKEERSTYHSSSEVAAKDEDKNTHTGSLLRSSPSLVSGLSLADLSDLLHRVEELQGRMGRAEEFINGLDEEKANRSALQRLNDDLRHLRQLLELGAAKNGDDAAANLAAAMQEELLQKVQQQLADNVQSINKIRDGTTNDLEALRNYVEKIDHCKADAKLVANKAERDYVENALERLMREVEQVLNATNAGLIDTLDKSLNVLRDMLDGKAAKNDMDSLRRMISEEHVSGGAPDALLGFRGFRCLGCNRAVETMRPRIMANRLQPFVNRLPQNHPSDPLVASLNQGLSDDRSGKPAMLKNN